MARWPVPLRGVALGTVMGLGVAAAIVIPTPEARAKSAFDSSYGYERTWNAGLRLVRVDLGLKVSEKDEQNGYLLFDYKSPESGPKGCPGSMEFIKGKDNEVRVVVQIPMMPAFHEQVMIDSLARKLRNEYGDPPKKPPPPPPSKDGGADAEPP